MSELRNCLAPCVIGLFFFCAATCIMFFASFHSTKKHCDVARAVDELLFQDLRKINTHNCHAALTAPGKVSQFVSGSKECCFFFLFHLFHVGRCHSYGTVGAGNIDTSSDSFPQALEVLKIVRPPEKWKMCVSSEVLIYTFALDEFWGVPRRTMSAFFEQYAVYHGEGTQTGLIYETTCFASEF